jgi:hypothetical protein
MATKSNKVLRVGFDLDGVILYNPARSIRPFVFLFKRIFLKNRLKKFWVPRGKWEKLFWRLAHKSSIFLAPGFDEIEKLVKEKKIEAYLVTGRFSFLKDDFEGWLKKMKAKEYFSGCYYNENDEQPHLFKQRLVKKLKLDYYIEDNWNIVDFLNSNNSSTKIFWIYNFFDKKINYPYKFPYLGKAIEKIVS